MAIGPLQQPWHSPSGVDPFEMNLTTYDVPIGGKLLQASMELNPIDQMNFASDDEYKRAIKKRIAADLARAMIESNMIEFTHLPQPSTGRDTIYARCYLAKDSDVKILRMHYAKPVRP